MLADREANGDNVATAEALAAVLQRLASRRVPGVAEPTVEAIRRAILAADDPRRGRTFSKTGSLASDPITVVRSGWVEPPGGGQPVVFVVMLAEANPGLRTRDGANADLAKLGDRLAEILVAGAPPAPR